MPEQEKTLMESEAKLNPARLVAAVLVIPLVIWGFFALAGRWDWPAGWVYVGLMLAGNTLQSLYLWRKNPGLLARRARWGQGTKNWDIACLAFFGIFYLGLMVVGALDGGRFHWSAMPAWLLFPGVVLLVFSHFLMGWSMGENPYFEKSVRIQTDCGHQVVDTGPYSVIRHPGYLATILGFILAHPLILGSWWSFVPALFAAGTIILRTYLEDRMLQQELPGYEKYAQQTSFRLLPGVW